MMESIFFNPWIWILPILVGVSLLMLIFGVWGAWYTSGDSIVAIMSAGFGGLAFLFLTPIYFGFVLPPYDASFYQTYRVAGELTTLESAFSGDEGTMSQTFVATVDGVDYFIKSDDQRFRSVDVGDDVTLTCTKGFEYFVAPWLDCRFGG